MPKMSRDRKAAHAQLKKKNKARRDTESQQVDVSEFKMKTEFEKLIDSLAPEGNAPTKPTGGSCKKCVYRFAEKCPTGGLGPVCSLWTPKPEQVTIKVKTTPTAQTAPMPPKKKKRKKRKRSKQSAEHNKTASTFSSKPIGTTSFDAYKPVDRRDVYRKQIEEAQWIAEEAWSKALVDYLEPKCIYNADRLSSVLSRRSADNMKNKVEICEAFVLDALSGKL